MKRNPSAKITNNNLVLFPCPIHTIEKRKSYVHTPNLRWNCWIKLQKAYNILRLNFKQTSTWEYSYLQAFLQKHQKIRNWQIIKKVQKIKTKLILILRNENRKASVDFSSERQKSMNRVNVRYIVIVVKERKDNLSICE